MDNGLSNFGEFLNMGSWGSEDYFRLRNKFFPHYLTTIKDEIDSIKLRINASLKQLTDVLSESVTITNLAISTATQDKAKAQSLMADAAAKLADANLKKATAKKTLTEYGNDANSAPILNQFDGIIARYETLNLMFTNILGGIDVDLVVFQAILPDIQQNEALLASFGTKFESASSLKDFQTLNTLELPMLTTSLNLLLNKALNLTRTTKAADEDGYSEEKTSMEGTLETLGANTEKIKTDEIERRRLEEERLRKEAERKKREEALKSKQEAEQKRQEILKKQKVGTKAVTIKDMNPSQFFAAYEARTDVLLNLFYSRSPWSKFKESKPTLVITGKDLTDAARAVYEDQKEKDLSWISPPELAVAQASGEGGLMPPNDDSDLAINPFNVAKTDGGNKQGSAVKLDEIKAKDGWKEARKKGIQNYYRLMYTSYMQTYSKPEDMLEYDSFNKHGGKEYTSRYATAFYHEAKLKSTIGLMHMQENGHVLSGTVSSTKGSDDDKKALYAYMVSFDKHKGKLQKTSYSSLVTLNKGVPSNASLSAAIKEIQDHEMFPEISTFSKSKKERADLMKKEHPVDYQQQVDARKYVDGEASKYGHFAGFLYYHHELITNGKVFNSDSDVSVTAETGDPKKSGTPAKYSASEIHKKYTSEEIDMVEFGKQLLPHCKSNPQSVIDVFDKLYWYEDDNLAGIIIQKSTPSELSSYSDSLLATLETAIAPGYFRIESDAEDALYEKVKKARGAEKEKISEDTKSTTATDGLTLSSSVSSEIRTWFNTEIDKTSIETKNASYARFILKAKELKICEIASEGKSNTDSGLSGVEDTFAKIRDGKKIGNGKKSNVESEYYFDPKVSEIHILPIVYDMLKKAVVRWDKNGRTGDISEIKLGSFMIWNTTSGKQHAGELRTTNHGFKGRAIDVNLDDNDFTKNSALESVNTIIADLPPITGTYEIGLPFQGQFYDIKDKTSGKLEKYSTKVDGKKGGDVASHLKSTKLKETISALKKKGYKFEFIPDNDNHLHLGIE